MGSEIWGDLEELVKRGDLLLILPNMILFNLIFHILFHFKPLDHVLPHLPIQKNYARVSPGCPVPQTLGCHTQNTSLISCSWAQTPFQYGG